MNFDLISSEPIYQGRAFSVRQDCVRLPDQRTTKLDVIEHIGSAIIVPVDEKGNLYFVRQYRHAARQELLELPAGTLEPDEDPLICAARELREETGMAAGKISEIGGFYLAPGYSTEFMRVYFATDLTHNPLDADEDEFLNIEIMPISQAVQMAEEGRLPDAKSLAALLLAWKYLA